MTLLYHFYSVILHKIPSESNFEFDDYGKYQGSSRIGPNLYEFGISTGSLGFDAYWSWGESTVYSSSILRDTVNYGIGTYNSVMDTFGFDSRFELFPDADSAYDNYNF